MTTLTALTDPSTFQLHDLKARDVRKDPAWLELLGEANVKEVTAKFDPHQPRGPHTGEWIDTTPGDGGKNPLDKLKPR
jgi:hypothetical protein